MKSIYYLWEAKRRLRASEDFIDLYGGEKECDNMILAQRDFIRLEVEYHRLGVRMFFSAITIAAIFSFFIYISWSYYAT